MLRSAAIALAAAVVGVMAGPGAASAVELVQDGGFENGVAASGWAQDDSFDNSSVCSLGTSGNCPTVPSLAAPRSGTWWTWFGGINLNLTAKNHNSSVWQSVTTTPRTPLVLSFWLWIGRSNQTAALNVSLGDQVLFAIRGDDPRYRQGYTRVVVPVPASVVSGGTQTLRFDYTSILGLLINYHAINVDDVSLQAADADLGVSLTSIPNAVTIGSTFATTLSASNAGPHAADEVTAEYPLPAGATVVGLAAHGATCAAPETAPGQTMSCAFGTLPAGATKSATITLRADAVGTVTQSATLAQRSGDPNGGNHHATAAVSVVAPPPDVPGPKPPKPPTCTAAKRFTVSLQRGTKGTGLLLKSHNPAKSRITSATLTGPKKFKTKKLRFTRSRVTVDLRKVPAGRYTVRTRVRLANRKTVSVTKAYAACGPVR